jgi:hypothetical protein
MFDPARLDRALADCASDASDLLESVLAALKDFTASQATHDDRTLLVRKYYEEPKVRFDDKRDEVMQEEQEQPPAPNSWDRPLLLAGLGLALMLGGYAALDYVLAGRLAIFGGLILFVLAGGMMYRSTPNRNTITMPDVRKVRRVTVVKEDVFGPMRNSLSIELRDGTHVSVDEADAIEAFLGGLAKFRPDIATSIREELAIIAPFCVEREFDLDG